MIPIAGPSITEKEIEYVRQAVTDSWYAQAGTWQARFERAFAEYTGRTYAVSTNSCTAAIHLALRALDIGPGDEVIVPELTWIATAAPVVYVGATPVFADVNPKSWCLDPDSVESHITPKTRAVIAVDLYGSMPNWAALTELARRYNLRLIEDAAQAMGSGLYGKKAGWFGDISVFSFHGTKTMTTCGEGGMLLTRDGAIVDKVHYYQAHCRDRHGKVFWNTDVGYKYKMTDVQAAMGCAQLERIDELVKKKTQIFEWYSRQFVDMGMCVEMNLRTAEETAFVNSYWMTTINYSGVHVCLPSKDELVLAMANKGVACRPFFYPLSSLPAFAGLEQSKFIRYCHMVDMDNKPHTMAYDVSEYAVNLPSALNLTEEDVATVCKTLKECL